MPKRKPYEKRTDLEKIHSQWHKLTGLHTHEEWSAAIVRAATAAELAANFAIRKEFESKSKFNSKFIDSLLRWGNGLEGKINRLLIPLTIGEKHHKIIKKLKGASEQINGKRNAIAHRGEFCNEAESKAAIQQSRKFVETLVQIYEPSFVL
ncbi:MAG: hypothetical protein WBL85_04720 [Sedimentisphaerales bacterium]